MESIIANSILFFLSTYPILSYLFLLLFFVLVFPASRFGRKRWWLRLGTLLLVATLLPLALNHPLNAAVGNIRSDNVPLAGSAPLQLTGSDIILLDWFDSYRARQTPDHTPCAILCQNLLYSGGVQAVLLPTSENGSATFWRFELETRSHCDPVVGLYGPAAMRNGVGECLVSEVIADPELTLKYSFERESTEDLNHLGSKIVVTTYLTEVVRFDESRETALFRETSVRANHIIVPIAIGMIADIKSGRRELLGRISRFTGTDFDRRRLDDRLFGDAVAGPTAPPNAMQVAINALRDPQIEASATHNLLFDALYEGQRSNLSEPNSNTRWVIEALRDPRVSRVYGGPSRRGRLASLVLPVDPSLARDLTEAVAARLLRNPEDEDNNAELNELLKRMGDDHIRAVAGQLYQMAENADLQGVAAESILRLAETEPNSADFFAGLLREVLDSGGQRPFFIWEQDEYSRQARLAIRALCLLGTTASHHDELLTRYYNEYIGPRPRRLDTLLVGRTLLRMQSDIAFRDHLTAQNLDHLAIFDSIERPPSPERCN
ncbi:MAG: hypothetical protein AAF234_00350 [Pseudomonadota bacterium]